MDGKLTAAVNKLESDVAAAADAYQASWLEMATELEQVKRQLKLAELSNHALREQMNKHARLSAVRLTRAKKAELALEMNGKAPNKRKLTSKEYANAQDD